ncbi:MAG: hypothetical protein OEY89_08505 [Gammaproteobacteria bacterium]|nr:hypothetical protein [Gammaproteobacteria bacterium]
MIKIPTATKVTIRLLWLTLGILFVADMLGITPNAMNVMLDARKKISESLAIQFSVAAQADDLILMDTTLQAIVEHNQDIISGALRMSDGNILLEAGLHRQSWPIDLGDKSTPDYVQVPIFRKDKFWGMVQIHFAEISPQGIFGINVNPLYPLLCFVTVVGFIAYRMIMVRTLKQLVPATQVSGQLRNALDALTEGVVIMDMAGNVVFANKVFLEKTSQSMTSVLDKNLADWGWISPYTLTKLKLVPWQQTLKDASNVINVPLSIKTVEGGMSTFVVNSSPILTNPVNMGEMVKKEEIRGVIATFTDTSKLETVANITPCMAVNA